MVIVAQFTYTDQDFVPTMRQTPLLVDGRVLSITTALIGQWSLHRTIQYTVLIRPVPTPIECLNKARWFTKVSTRYWRTCRVLNNRHGFMKAVMYGYNKRLMPGAPVAIVRWEV